MASSSEPRSPATIVHLVSRAMAKLEKEEGQAVVLAQGTFRESEVEAFRSSAWVLGYYILRLSLSDGTECLFLSNVPELDAADLDMLRCRPLRPMEAR